jgi:formate dehydrogenase subunit gamma
MRTGYVDEAWAKEHHSVWYREVKEGRAPQKFADDVQPETRARILQAIQEHTR